MLDAAVAQRVEHGIHHGRRCTDRSRLGGLPVRLRTSPWTFPQQTSVHDDAGSFDIAACISMIDLTRSGVRARAIPHSVAIPKVLAYLLAVAMRRLAPSTPSAACTTPK